MNASIDPPRNSKRRRWAFTRIDLIVIIGMIALLASLLLPQNRTSRSQSQMVVDLNNVRQVLVASQIYASENSDMLAHPTWGTDGPDGWAYATQSHGLIPGGPTTPPSCAGQDVNSTAFSNQVAFFKIGQLGPYLNDYHTLWCPKDVATRQRPRLRSLWLQRPVKVTSYCWNATIGGYVGNTGTAPPSGRAYKLADFHPTDWQMWEPNENEPFNFNDAAVNPENASEGFSLRHLNISDSWYNLPASFSTNTQITTQIGGCLIGTFGGSAQLVKWARCWPLIGTRTRPPNEILNGPRYKR